MYHVGSIQLCAKVQKKQTVKVSDFQTISKEMEVQYFQM